MMKKMMVVLFLLTLLVLGSGCSQELKQGDVVVWPEQNPETIQSGAVNTQTGLSNMGSNNISNNSANASANMLAGWNNASSGQVLDALPKDKKWLDFEVEGRYIYLLEKTGETEGNVEYGNKITVYNVEGQKLIGSIGDSDSMYTVVAVYKGVLYAYDYNKGEMHVFDGKGAVKEKVPIIPGLQCVKMLFSRDGWLLMQVQDKENVKMMIFNPFLKLLSEVKAADLSKSLNYSPTDGMNQSLDICDFDLYDENCILIKVTPRRLCLYNFKKGVVDGASYFNDSSNMICFNTNVLYSVSEARLAVFTNYVTNANSAGSPDKIERTMINSRFPWNSITENMDEWRINPIELLLDGFNAAHQKIKYRGKYIYLLDYSIDTKPDSTPFQSMIVRVNGM